MDRLSYLQASLRRRASTLCLLLSTSAVSLGYRWELWSCCIFGGAHGLDCLHCASTGSSTVTVGLAGARSRILSTTITGRIFGMR